MTYPDPDIDPTGYVLAVTDEVEAEASRVSLGDSDRCFHTPEDDAWLVDFYLAEAALWRGIADRHGDRHHYCVGRKRSGRWEQRGQFADWIAELCPDLLAVVAAAKAYAVAS